MNSRTVSASELYSDEVAALLSVFMMKMGVKDFSFGELEADRVSPDTDITISYNEDTDEITVSLINE